MRAFFQYRMYLVILLLIVTGAIYWRGGLFADQAVGGVVKSIPFIVIAVLAIIPTSEKYRDRP